VQEIKRHKKSSGARDLPLDKKAQVPGVGTTAGAAFLAKERHQSVCSDRATLCLRTYLPCPQPSGASGAAPNAGLGRSGMPEPAVAPAARLRAASAAAFGP
jgi:hypothetical protein